MTLTAVPHLHNFYSSPKDPRIPDHQVLRPWQEELAHRLQGCPRRGRIQQVHHGECQRCQGRTLNRQRCRERTLNRQRCRRERTTIYEANNTRLCDK